MRPSGPDVMGESCHQRELGKPRSHGGFMRLQWFLFVFFWTISELVNFFVEMCHETGRYHLSSRITSSFFRWGMELSNRFFWLVIGRFYWWTDPSTNKNACMHVSMYIYIFIFIFRFIFIFIFIFICIFICMYWTLHTELHCPTIRKSNSPHSSLA